MATLDVRVFPRQLWRQLRVLQNQAPRWTARVCSRARLCKIVETLLGCLQGQLLALYQAGMEDV